MKKFTLYWSDGTIEYTHGTSIQESLLRAPASFGLRVLEHYEEGIHDTTYFDVATGSWCPKKDIKISLQEAIHIGVGKLCELIRGSKTVTICSTTIADVILKMSVREAILPDERGPLKVDRSIAMTVRYKDHDRRPSETRIWSDSDIVQLAVHAVNVAIVSDPSFNKSAVPDLSHYPAS